MTKLRDDLIGVVYLNGRAYAAGDEVPDDVRVGAHLTEDGEEHGAPATTESPVVATASVDTVEPLTPEEIAAAEAVGLPTDVSPERVRGALVGYEQGVADSLTLAATGTTFDPADVDIDAVETYLTEHPTEKLAVLVLEATGKARKTILGEYL